MIYDTIDELRESLKGCGLCPKMVKSRLEVLGEKYNAPVMFKGNSHAPFFFVGQCPGRKLEHMDKDKLSITMEPFQYGSGQVLDKVLQDAGFNVDEVFITNVVLCNTPADNFFIDKDVKRCIKLWLENEITLVKPKAIIVMGRIAYEWFTKYVDEDVIRGIRVFRVNHPAFIAYRPEEYDNYLRSITKIRESIVNEEDKK